PAPTLSVSLCSSHLSLSLPYHAHTPTSRSTLSLHDALPIYDRTVEKSPTCRALLPAGIGDPRRNLRRAASTALAPVGRTLFDPADRKSTRLNSSHCPISYAVSPFNTHPLPPRRHLPTPPPPH